MAYRKQIDELRAREAKARAMGSPRRLEERRAAGVLNARERLDLLLDPDSFKETGLLAVSAREADRERSPADGMVSGFGEVDGRMVGVNSADFTTLGASSAYILGKKQFSVRNTCADNGLPLIQLIECSGGRIPDIMGASGIGMTGEGYHYEKRREVPWLAAVLGMSYGGGTWMTMLSDFRVMRKGAVMAVSSPLVTSVAISEEQDPEALGGWRLHTETTGLIDAAADSDEEAIAMLRRFLDYMPDHAGALPRRADVPAGSDDDARTVLDLVPEDRGRVYDVRKVVRAVADKDSVFELKDRYAKSAVTALARLDGRVVGFVASNPMFKGGALDPDACSKITSFLVLCDSYNIPLIFLADTPGFLVGVEGERQKLAARIMTFIQALELTTVPKFALVLRKSFGQAYLNMAGGRADDTSAWFTGEISFMDPAVAVNVVYAVRREDDPERYDELLRQVSQDSSAYDLAAAYMARSVIDPRETRAHLKRLLEIHRRAPTGGIGEHRMATWPSNF